MSRAGPPAAGPAQGPGGGPSEGNVPPWLQGALRDRRIVRVTGRLDDSVAATATAALLSLDAESDAPIEIHVLGSADGSLEAAFLLIDTLGTLRSPIRARCHGLVGTPAIGVVAAAGERVAGPHARFRLAQPAVRLTGRLRQVEAETRQHLDLLVRFEAHLARVTGRPVDEIADDLRRGRALDAREARDYGLVDAISDATG